jgi:hypothetical protein
LIYVAAYEDRSLVDHEKIYKREVVWLSKPENKMWRSYLYNELEQWWRKHPPSSKKRKSMSIAAGAPDIDDDDRRFMSVDNFVDPRAPSGWCRQPSRSPSGCRSRRHSGSSGGGGGGGGASGRCGRASVGPGHASTACGLPARRGPGRPRPHGQAARSGAGQSGLKSKVH